MENSRSKQFLSFKLHSILSIVMKSCTFQSTPPHLDPHPSASSALDVQPLPSSMIQGHLEKMTFPLTHGQKVTAASH